MRTQASAVVSKDSNGFARTKSEQALFCLSLAVVAQLVEHSHGKGEVIGSIPINGSTDLCPFLVQ